MGATTHPHCLKKKFQPSALNNMSQGGVFDRPLSRLTRPHEEHIFIVGVISHRL
jgi:hypothetical protein